MTRQKLFIILALIVLLGLFLRLYDLNAEGLWLDEGGSIMKSNASMKEFTLGRPPIMAPPLYYLLLSYWIKSFGNSEISVRLLSVLFGTLSILILFRIGERIYDKITGLTAAFIFSISTFHIYFSQETRMYSLLVLLTLCSMYYFLKLVTPGPGIDRVGSARGSSITSFLYLLSSILLLYTHNFGISPLVAQNIFAVTLLLRTGRIGRMKLKNWIILQSLLLITFLPWLIIIIKQFINIQEGYWSPSVSIRSLLETMLDYSGSYWLLVLFIALSIIAWSIPSLNRRNRQSPIISNTGRDDSPLPGPLFLFIWLLVPCLLPFIISIFSTPIYISRITISASPALYLMVAGGIKQLRQKMLIIGSISLIGILSLPGLWNYYHTTHKEPLREVISRVETEVQPGDIILLMPLWYKKFVFNYYQTRKDIPARGFSYGSINTEDLKELMDLTEHYRRIWIILCQGEDISLFLQDKFPVRFNPSDYWVIDYFNFQARKKMAIRVYLIN